MTEENPEHVDRFFHALTQREAVVLHLRHGVVDQVDRYYDGEVERHPTFSGRCLQTKAGHCFVAVPEHFVELGPGESLVVDRARELLRSLASDVAATAMRAGVQQLVFKQLIACVLRESARAAEGGR